MVFIFGFAPSQISTFSNLNDFLSMHKDLLVSPQGDDIWDYRWPRFASEVHALLPVRPVTNLRLPRGMEVPPSHPKTWTPLVYPWFESSFGDSIFKESCVYSHCYESHSSWCDNHTAYTM